MFKGLKSFVFRNLVEAFEGKSRIKTRPIPPKDIEKKSQSIEKERAVSKQVWR